jgi:hypothetical protein
MLGYMALATLHAIGLSAADALNLPDHEFMQKFLVPMCTSFTVCPNSMVYSGDMTLDAKGNLDQATEDFGMVQCHHYFIGVSGSYTNRYSSISTLSATCPEGLFDVFFLCFLSQAYCNKEPAALTHT